MDENRDTNSAHAVDPQPAVILEISNNDGIIARINIVQSDDLSWSLTIDGDFAKVEVVQRALNDVTTSKASESYPSDVRNALLKAGFSVRIAAQRKTVSITVDTYTGRTFATAKSVIDEESTEDAKLVNWLRATTKNAF